MLPCQLPPSGVRLLGRLAECLAKELNRTPMVLRIYPAVYQAFWDVVLVRIRYRRYSA
jgi:hypothetical protein